MIETVAIEHIRTLFRRVRLLQLVTRKIFNHDSSLGTSLSVRWIIFQLNPMADFVSSFRVVFSIPP